MCLTVYNKGFLSLFCSKEEFKASKDITCYKLVIKNINEDGTCTYVSPFQDEWVWETGKTYTDEISLYKWQYDKDRPLHIGRGMFHTNRTLFAAKLLKKWLMNEWSEKKKNFAIAKCVIPKGTEMYKGWFAETPLEIRNYASKKLKVVKIFD